MIVNREREIRSFVKTPFYRVLGNFQIEDKSFSGEWRAVEGSKYFQSPALYKENGFKEEKDAVELIDNLKAESSVNPPKVESIEKKKENKNPPLLYNLAELQNDCSKYFKISPDQTLAVVQELYEKKMTTYPRTDARVLSTAVAKEIHKNIGGLKGYSVCGNLAAEVLAGGSYKQIAKTRYVNDKQITDHYAIIPTGQGLNNLASLSPTSAKVYEIIVRRFLSIFYPPAVYIKFALKVKIGAESFFANFKVLEEEGYLKAAFSFKKDKQSDNSQQPDGDNDENEEKCDAEFVRLLRGLKKGAEISVNSETPFEIKEGETTPPKRYTSGSIILTMENAGQFIEDEELRAQIKGSGIGTSATRAEILKKLVKIEYLNLNNKTQVLTPTLMGEMIYDVVGCSIKPLLNPALTASWEKGLTMVADGTITADEYMKKLDDFVSRRTNVVKQLNNQSVLYNMFRTAEENYKK
jgi:DNA topoisomerase-3